MLFLRTSRIRVLITVLPGTVSPAGYIHFIEQQAMEIQVRLPQVFHTGLYLPHGMNPRFKHHQRGTNQLTYDARIGYCQDADAINGDMAESRCHIRDSTGGPKK